MSHQPAKKLYVILYSCLALFLGYFIGKQRNSVPEQTTKVVTKKKVMVSGCFDLLHAGHVAFFKEAATYGDLYVYLGSDKTITQLKQHQPMFPQEERRYMVSAIKWVHKAKISQGTGIMDFEAEMDVLQPDIFFVNEDGHRPSKEEACRKRNIQYIVSKRIPEKNLEARSSTAIKAALKQNKQ